MFYECKTVSLIQVPKGVKEPLCNSCLSRDCDNPVEKHSIALPTGKTEWRLLMRGKDAGIVLACRGYQSKKSPTVNPYSKQPTEQDEK